MAINSEPYAGRPACTNCGFCSGYGCPIVARAGAIAPLHDALAHGAELRADTMVTAIRTSGSTVTGVTWVGTDGRPHDEAADVVVLAANPIESVRLALLSKLPDPNGTLGRHLMFHWFTDGSGIFLDERLHAYRGRALTHNLDDFCDPDFPGARDAARAAGLPYLRGGTIEMGGTQTPIDEANAYVQVLPVLAPTKPFGAEFKQLMRASLLRDRLLGMTMMGEDLPYPGNRIDLDPSLVDWRGVPSPRITYGPGPHELAAQAFYLPRMVDLLKAAGADVALAIPNLPSNRFPLASNTTPKTMHVLGGMRMGADPRTSVTDGVGRHHQLDNLFVADGGTFPTSGAHNPTLTIMATTMRNARRWTR
jgi:gluconate 2-dehydrogenase alpha chain